MSRSSSRRKPVKIVILGAGGNSLAITDAIIAVNSASRTGPVYKLLGFLDDLPENQGNKVAGFPVLGTIDEARDLRECRFVNGIGSVESFRKKLEVVSRAGVPMERFETIVHPSAVVAPSAIVGRGSAIMANSVICPAACVEEHVIVLQNSSINHHSRLGRFATVSAGVTVLGFVDVGEGAFLSGGVSVAPYVKIGAGALVGLGAAVIRDVAPGAVVAGNPARELPSSRFAASNPET